MDFSAQFILACITATLTGLVSYLLYKLKKWEEIRDSAESSYLDDLAKRNCAFNDALCALCRDRILQGYRYYKQHGFISTQDLETMTKLYLAYHNLGGNGTITAVYNKILSFPIKSEV